MILEVYSTRKRRQKSVLIAYFVGRLAREFSIGQLCVSAQSPQVLRKQIQRSAKPLSFQFPVGVSAIILVIGMTPFHTYAFEAI